VTGDVHSGAEILDVLRDLLRHYVVFPDEHSAVAVTCWIAATHALPAFMFAPRLVLSSPEKRCGKSRLLDVIELTCHDPMMTVNTSTAAVFRRIANEQDHPPVILLDEADAVFGTKRAAEANEDLRALLNAGHQRGRPAWRCVGPLQTPTPFPTFAMAALAGIGTMPDTIVDRAVCVTMRRRAAGEPVAQFRVRRDGPVLGQMQERLAEWAASQLNALEGMTPEMPVRDRAADTWEPLVAIADVAGGDWPDLIRAACVALVSRAENSDRDKSLRIQLLADIRRIFTEQGVPFLTSTALVAALRQIEESPWDDFDLTARKLALKLVEFNIKPRHNPSKTARGYRLDDLADAFSRYLRPDPSEPSDMDYEQQEQPDGSQTPDGSTRPGETTRPRETPGQAVWGTHRTGPDAPPAENSTPPGGVTDKTPGQTSRVASIIARQKATQQSSLDRCRPPGNATCDEPPLEGKEVCERHWREQQAAVAKQRRQTK
jgi:hypothetical protein